MKKRVRKLIEGFPFELTDCPRELHYDPTLDEDSEEWRHWLCVLVNRLKADNTLAEYVPINRGALCSIKDYMLELSHQEYYNCVDDILYMLCRYKWAWSKNIVNDIWYATKLLLEDCYEESI